ncbi:MAG: hypothetical protein GY862_28025, partial [Gammaproteobacteria bacterium]|nr:hypothetical protein [Gammaproteobacteria bacterium]
MKRIVIRLFLAVLLVAALFFGAAGWITGTEAGLSWLVRQAEYQLPGKLTIKRVQGRLLDSFSIKGLVYVQDAADEPDGGIDGLPPQETRIAAASLAFVWRPAELLNGKLYIEKLHVHGLDAQLPKGRAEKTKDAPPAAPPQFPELPVEIVLDDVQIKSLNIKQPPIIIDSVELRATAGDTLAISRLRVESPLFTAAADGSLQLQTTPHPVQLNLNYSVDLPVAPGEGPEAKKTPGIVKISGQGVLSGDMRELTLETLRNDLLQGVLTVTGKASLQPSLAASLQLNADNLVLTELWPDWPGGLHLNAELTAAFTEKDFDILGLVLK